MKNQSSLLLILVTYAAFISLGLPDGLLGIAWPYMSVKFHVPLDALGVLLIGFVAGYLTTSTTSGKILSLIPLGPLLTASCCMTGLCLFAYAFSDHWFLIIVASFFLGSGGGAIDSSINTFAASRFSASVVNWLHAFYGIGATAGPLIMTWLLAHDGRWQQGYIIVGVIQILLAAIFMMTLKSWTVSAAAGEAPAVSASYAETFRIPIVWLNMLIFFLYTGLEVGVGQWIFTVLTKSRNLEAEEAGMWTSAYWGSLTAGRILFGIILTRLSVHQVITAALTGVVMGAILIVLNQSHFLTLTGIILTGMANAPVFPSLISITPERTGEKYAAHAIGFQISSAMLGAALLPAFAGWMTKHYGLEIISSLFTLEAILLCTLYLITARMYKSLPERIS